MNKGRSFKSYIENSFYNELFNAVLTSLKASVSEYFTLDDIELKTVWVEELPGMKIAFDVVVEAVYEISRINKKSEKYEQQSPWFLISCTGDLSKNLMDFEIIKIEEYYNRNIQENPLSDALVPIIKKEELDKTAHAILTKYYKEALENPIKIDPFLLAERMGLTVKLKNITKDLTVFGQIFFSDNKAKYYDKEDSRYKQIDVKAGTILVDPDAYFLRNYGCINNTIIHECVHWEKHRKAFELQRLYNSSLTKIKCQVSGGIKGSNKESADWMEWQANALTPRILMPYNQAKEKATEFLNQHLMLFPDCQPIDVMESVIEKMASFFGVSRQAARIRMADLGFEEAFGTFLYLDGRYVKPHSFKKGTLKENQTFSISQKDAVIESVVNRELNEKLKSGHYIFVDSHFCTNNPKYIQYDEVDRTSLTEYARHHMDECCLVFDLSLKSAHSYYQGLYTECYFYRDATSQVAIVAKFSDSQINDNVEARAQSISAHTKNISDILDKMPNKFNAALSYLMKQYKKTVEDLAFDVSLDPRTIQRLRNEEDYQTSIETLLAICIALQLPPPISKELISKSIYSLNNSEKHLVYGFFLCTFYTKTLEECNQMLLGMGYTPLTKEI